MKFQLFQISIRRVKQDRNFDFQISTIEILNPFDRNFDFQISKIEILNPFGRNFDFQISIIEILNPLIKQSYLLQKIHPNVIFLAHYFLKVSNIMNKIDMSNYTTLEEN